jgi:hypothetical protein
MVQAMKKKTAPIVRPVESPLQRLTSSDMPHRSAVGVADRATMPVEKRTFTCRLEQRGVMC